MKKYIAELTKWNGEKIQQEIQEEWISGIVDAVVGQFAYFDKNKGFGINGSEFAHVDVFEVGV